MIISSSLFNNELDFGKHNVWNIVVENPVYLRKMILGLQNIDIEESFFVYDDGRAIPISEAIEVIQSVLPFDLNTKEIVSALVKRVEKVALSSEYYLETQTLLHNIQNYQNKLTFDFPCEIAINKLTISALIKASGLEVLFEDEYIYSQLIMYMKLVRELIRDRIFVFVHLNEILSNDEMNIFINEVQLNHFKVILLGSHMKNNLKEIMTLIIDQQLCEIIGE